MCVCVYTYILFVHACMCIIIHVRMCIYKKNLMHDCHYVTDLHFVHVMYCIRGKGTGVHVNVHIHVYLCISIGI